MAQSLSDREFDLWREQTAKLAGRTAGSRSTTVRRALAAVDELVESAVHGDRSKAEVAAILLEAAVTETRRARSAPGAMPDDERRAWEELGASFAEPQAVARGRGRSAASFAGLLARSVRGDAAVAKRLKVDRSRISQRLSERSLLAVSHGGERYFPLWQFDEASVLRGLRSVLVVMDPGLHPLTVDHWFNAPSLELVVGDEAVTPVEWLRTGGGAEALTSAAAEL